MFQNILKLELFCKRKIYKNIFFPRNEKKRKFLKFNISFLVTYVCLKNTIVRNKNFEHFRLRKKYVIVHIYVFLRTPL